MAGDKIDIFAKSYYLNTGTINNANSTPLDVAGLLANLVAAPGNAMVAKGATASNLLTINSGLIPSTFFRGNNGETTTIPKGYVNYILFDEHFKYVKGGFSRVGTSGLVKDHWQAGIDLQAVTVDKNGYIFVYVSNESNVPVFFDNLQVIHKPGPILEETHYYPFGLTMVGISTRGINIGGNDIDCNCPNTRGFNGNELQHAEFSDASGLNLYDFNARTYDHQLGRFIQIDPLSDQGEQESLSEYHFGYNNPISFEDADGKCPICPAIPWIFEGVKIIGTAVIAYIVVDEASEFMEDSNNKSSSNNSNTSNNSHSRANSIYGRANRASKNQNNAARQRSESDRKLVREAENRKAREQIAKDRQQSRQRQTQTGKTKEGRSNKVVKGDHNTKSRGSSKNRHEKANARRGKDQKKAEEYRRKTDGNRR